MNNIKKLAKYIRIITVAPVMAFVLINLLFFCSKEEISLITYLLSIFTLVIFPLLAYPIQNKYKIIKGDQRSSERKLAIVFSNVGYFLGLIIMIVLDATSIEKIMFMTYALSGVLIAFFSFGIRINSSGHMCGVAGPIALIVFVFGPIYFVLSLLLLLVIWSSLYLKRHNVFELLIGSIIPIISLIISIIIFK